ncbi:MAG: cytochrome C biogenesis protein [Solirubrobacterales bacterium]|nr:cytochrome C biogenesis protein [Solirubrobacterales bacterium]
MSTAVTLAFGAGLLATVNPCGFALLPGFLSFYLGGCDDARAGALSRARQGFAVGLVLSGAFSAVFIIVGLIVSAGLRSVLTAVPWVAFGIGLVLIALGGVMLAGRRVSLLSASHLAPGLAQRTGYARVAAFGVAYALASLSCTLAVFLVVVGQALTVSGVVQTLAVFGAYAAGSASVLLALSVSAALAQGALARAVRRLAPFVNRLAGALLLLSGLYLTAYWLPALGDGSPNSTGALASRSERISSALADFFAAHTGVFAAALAVLLAAGAGLAAQRGLARRRINQTQGATR